MASRVLLLLPTTSYKADEFLASAAALDVELVVATERRQALQDAARGTTVRIDFASPRPQDPVLALHRERPFGAVLGVDDETTIAAARIAGALGLPHDDVQAVRRARDKHATRVALREAGLPGPRFRRLPIDADVPDEAARAGYPCVLKPLHLSAARGVLRADSPAEFGSAFRRIVAILARRDARDREGDAGHILVESFIPGREVALEGLLERGVLHTLALFDKPDPMDGPTFEETLLVTPSRLAPGSGPAIERRAAAVCAAIGLRDGPVHVECRVDGERVVPLEVAPRTIGGLCSRAVRESLGVSLETLVLERALGRLRDLSTLDRRPAGALMIPVTVPGVLRAVRGLEAAADVPGVLDVVITTRNGTTVEPLPEGHAYLGFVFAGGRDAAAVERALREAWSRLEIVIDQNPGESDT